MNPRWRVYSRLYGITSIAGQYAPFTAWIGERWAEWCALTGVPLEKRKEPEDHEAFDAWLQSWRPS